MFSKREALSKFTSILVSLQCQQWLQKKRERYMSHEVQNELIKLMALSVLRKIAGDLQATEFISVMIDECTDIQNKEQVNTEPVICMLIDSSVAVWFSR